MSLLRKINNFRRPAHLTRGRVAFVMIVAVVADALQFWLTPLGGWAGAVQVIDVATMIITTLTIGFHILLLPTFLIELFPVVSAIPTWTGCVLAVLALRGRDEAGAATGIVPDTLPPEEPKKLPPPPVIPPAPLASKSPQPPPTAGA